MSSSPQKTTEEFKRCTANEGQHVLDPRTNYCTGCGLSAYAIESGRIDSARDFASYRG